MKRILIVLLFVLGFIPIAASDTTKKVSETPEQKAKADRFLAAQEKGKPIKGDTIQKPLETNPERTLIKKLETHSPKKLRSASTSPQREPIKKPIETHSIPLKKLGEGDQKNEARVSRFKPEQIQNRLQTGEKIGPK
ncbi:MAG: hypothetical protein HY590_01660 [Candidatus Omnitrophica bacterium]|nr:hypothetical protein [Candidatus Omnitrophota bacterium]